MTAAEASVVQSVAAGRIRVRLAEPARVVRCHGGADESTLGGASGGSLHDRW